tara:strand:+ start:678 stop:1163 length:486 start_codon:yes stop_codon:yes gene_type:complete
MATTIVPATLKVTLTEKVTLNSKERGQTNTFSTSNITSFYERIITIPASAVEGATTKLLSFSDTVNDATSFLDTTVDHVRITNLDSSISVLLRVIAQSNANTRFTIKLPPGKSFLLGTTKMAVTTTGAVWAEDEINEIHAFYEAAPSSAVDLEVIVGQKNA